MRVKSSGLAPELANARPLGSAKFANTTSPGLTRRATAPLRRSPGGGGRGVLGAAGIDCCIIMHMAGYFEVISFLILPVFNFLILFNKKKKKKRAAELCYVIFTPAPGLPTKLGEAERANLISRFWRDSISQGFIFAISTGKYEQRILNFAIQVFSTSHPSSSSRHQQTSKVSLSACCRNTHHKYRRQ